MKRTLFLSGLLLFVELQISGQGSLPSMNYIPQEPRAATYTRYGEIPVDFSTGVPDINIPLYEIKSGALSVPISISYHASGIKVNDVASEVGLGWLLDAGGVITQTLLGRLGGEGPTNFGGATNFTPPPYDDYMWWWIIAGGGGSPDFYTDRFYYKLPGRESGIFRPDIMQPNSFVIIPYRPIKIDTINIDNKPGFKLTDADGTQYYFVKVHTGLESQIYVPKEIISSNYTDTINFYYKNAGFKVFHQFYNVYEWWEDKPIVNTCLFDQFIFEKGCNPDNNLFTNSSQWIYVPDSICTNHQKVEFKYFFDREDDLQDRAGPGPRLNRINVYDDKGKMVKSVKFYNDSYFQSTEWTNRVELTKRLRLDSILISGNDTLTSLNYSFKYYEEESLPPYADLTFIKFYEDYWGYYNGREKVRLMPSFLDDYIGSPYYNPPFTFGDLHPDENFMKAGILTEIHYPTGGKTVFEYEGNRAETNPYPYTSTSHGSLLGMGGLRIKQITSFSENNTLIKSYEYEQTVNKILLVGNYQYDQPVFVFHRCPENPYLAQSTTYTKHGTTSTPYRPITLYNGSSVLYGKVTEYTGTPTSNIGKTEYFYDIDGVYDEIAVPESANDYPWFFTPYQWEHGNYTPTLAKKLIFKNNNGIYDTVRMEINQYDEFKQNSFLTGLNLTSNIDLESWGTATIDMTLDNFETDMGYNYYYSLVYSDNIAYTNTKLLTYSTIIDFTFGGDKINSWKSFNYEDDYLLLASETESRSEGSYLKTRYKYPFDFSSAEPDPYLTMINKHIYSPIIETSDFLGESTPLQSTKTNYLNWGSNIIAPVSIETTTGTSSPDLRMNYNSYDYKGNITQYTQRDGIVVTLFWAYNQSLPVAKIESGNTITVSETLRNSINNHSYGGTDIKSSIDFDISFLETQLSSYISNLNNQVTLYTYKPLVGMTSQTEPNGETTYYEYDSFGRLSCIRDDDGYILKTYDYHYKQ